MSQSKVLFVLVFFLVNVLHAILQLSRPIVVVIISIHAMSKNNDTKFVYLHSQLVCNYIFSFLTF